MKYSYLLILLLLTACTSKSSEPSILKNTRNKKVFLEFKTVNYDGSKIDYNLFRERYPFVSLTYLDEGCHSCYAKAYVWYTKRDQLPKDSSIAYVFIFRGKDFDGFIKKAIGNQKFPYHVIFDSSYTYVKRNEHIPLEIIDNTILIDNRNRIKVFGEPLADSIKNEYRLTLSAYQ